MYIYIISSTWKENGVTDVVVAVELSEAKNQEKKRETIAGQGPRMPLVLRNVIDPLYCPIG